MAYSTTQIACYTLYDGFILTVANMFAYNDNVRLRAVIISLKIKIPKVHLLRRLLEYCATYNYNYTQNYNYFNVFDM